MNNDKNSNCLKELSYEEKTERMHRELLAVLKSDSFTLTLEEIEGLMDKELSKGPNEMDTELIDLCAATLEKAYSEIENNVNSEKKSET